MEPDQFDMMEAHELRAELREIIKAGWRSCIDHIIKPGSSCPVCKLDSYREALETIRDGIPSPSLFATNVLESLSDE